MICYNCKKKISDDTVFCPYCGQVQTVDEAWIEAAKKGDQQALTQLYERTYGAVYNTVKFIVKNEEDALDILQDSYIKAFSSLDQLQEAGKFGPWVKRIAHNKAIDLLRRSKPAAFSEMVPEDSDEVLEFEDDRPDSLPDVVVDRQETTRLIQQTLDSLPDEQRVCISLFYFDQLSVKEIASELDIPEATVKSRLQYGRKKIETQVRALEKKGIKLYGLAPVPFFMLLLRQQAQAAVSPSVALLNEALTASAGSTLAKKMAGTIGGGAIKAATAHTVKTAVMSRIIASAVVLMVIGGGTTAAVIHHEHQRAARKEEVVQEAVEDTQLEGFVDLEESEDPTPPTHSLPERSEEGSSEPDPVLEESEMKEPSEEKPVEATDLWQEAYQAVLDAYQACMSEGINGTNPYLRYGKVQYVLESNTGKSRLVYTLFDVNQDKIPELILGLQEFWDEEISWTTPFEIYTMEGDTAVPLFQEILKDHETLHIGNKGELWIDSGNSGFSPTTFYELSSEETEIKETMAFDTVEEENFSDSHYRQIVEGEDRGNVSREEFENIWLPEDAFLTYHSILDPISSALGDLAIHDSFMEKISYIKEQLNVPTDLGTLDKVHMHEAYYWEDGDVWLVYCEFYYEGELIASAAADQETGEVVRDIMAYSEN